MKRIAGTFMLLASLGGCMQTGQTPNKTPFAQAKPSPARKAANPAPSSYVGPYGEPIVPGNLPAQGMSPGLSPAGYVAGNNPKAGTNLIQAGYLETDTDCGNCAPGSGKNVAATASMGSSMDPGSAEGMAATASHHKHKMPAPPRPPGTPFYQQNDGIVPVPFQGPPGAVAAIGALPAQVPMGPMNMRSSVNFASPDGMRVTWYGPTGWNAQPLITPARYNFLQGGVYRMRLSSIVNRLEKVYYPTLEVVPAQETTATYLAHSSVPVTFTDEDFEQVDSGNFLVKVVYLPNPNNQDLATVVGPNELVSTRLEPGIDPIVEAQRRGTILLIIRLGNIDLNTPNSPAMDAPNPFMMAPGMNPAGPPIPGTPPGAVPPGQSIPIAPPGATGTESVPPAKEIEPMPKSPSGSKADASSVRRPNALTVINDVPGKKSVDETAPGSPPMSESESLSEPESKKQADSRPKRPFSVLP